jgi:hypothetical protein
MLNSPRVIWLSSQNGMMERNFQNARAPQVEECVFQPVAPQRGDIDSKIVYTRKTSIEFVVTRSVALFIVGFLG